MKIKQLDIKGFRSLKEVSWKPGELNVVIGQNGTGKSNLLRMLELISASAQGQLSREIQTAGGMNAILWDGRVSTVSFQLGVEDRDSQPSFVGGASEYGLEMNRMGNTSSYRIEHEVLAHDQSRAFVKGGLKVNIIERGSGKVLFRGEEVETFGKLSEEESALSLGSVVSLFFPVDKAKRPYVQSVENRLQEQLNGISVYHEFDTDQNSKVRQAVIARFEKRVEPGGQNLISVLHSLYTGDREFERNIDAAMRAAFGAAYEKLVFPPAADQRVQLRVRWKTLQREQSAADLSDGTLRFLLLLAVLASPDPPMLIAVDEPETGLHPAMLPIIAEYAVEAATRTQLAFTTYSPQFLDAFTETKPTTSVTTWENGETSLHTIEGKELKYWIEDYSLGTLFKSGQLEAMT